MINLKAMYCSVEAEDELDNIDTLWTGIEMAQADQAEMNLQIYKAILDIQPKNIFDMSNIPAEDHDEYIATGYDPDIERLKKDGYEAVYDGESIMVFSKQSIKSFELVLEPDSGIKQDSIEDPEEFELSEDFEEPENFEDDEESFGSGV